MCGLGFVGFADPLGLVLKLLLGRKLAARHLPSGGFRGRLKARTAPDESPDMVRRPWLLMVAEPALIALVVAV
jgi:hypothetical protein